MPLCSPLMLPAHEKKPKRLGELGPGRFGKVEMLIGGQLSHVLRRHRNAERTRKV
ncbi:MAG: hypothetical protein H6940_13020 [Burkholderiales bacterium]|uniref:hypothetical protein n=1 Tax=Nitrosomonas sp. TaxID=42353 RepID=UPI001E0FC7C7|nr:hypothetical protein [Nitrosomonas sp.]MCB1949141.1 hypothetical protein [Nitrosomonas sp.]MCP5244323.1 hypothetical protein [Burkholderiales bacterium]